MDGSFEPLQGMSLHNCEAGGSGRILHVSDSDPEFLRYLTSLGVKLASHFRVMSKAPFEGPLTLRIGRRDVIIGQEAARRILIAPDES